MKKLSVILTLVFGVLLVLTILPIIHSMREIESAPAKFSGDNAYNYVLYQCKLGARIPGSNAHQQLIEYISETVTKYAWQVTFQPFSVNGKSYQNIIATRTAGEEWFMLGAHFDSRQFADRDPYTDLRTQPVPGANDGASGVAVLLELARILPDDLPFSISLVFFDAEDQGGIKGQDWIMGSSFYAASLVEYPNAFILLDMVGDENQQFFYESNSDVELRKSIWDIAASLGYEEHFTQKVKYTLIDDHIPFVELGIPSVDIIDFEYEHWHTTLDTPKYVSPSSLERVGNVVYEWLLSQNTIK